MNPIVQVSASALFTRNVLQYLKDKGYISGSLQITLANFLLSAIVVFFTDIFTSIANGTPLTATLFKAAATTVAAALYNDLNTFVKGISQPFTSATPETIVNSMKG